ncbi:MAG: hypothetical protein LBE35_04275 [Clostridiales bacterium]|jgi:hypothetical protein|nr:hypothetical protein [Clostridiales bacterium]
MYRKIDPPLHMTEIEASSRFPDEYILMQRDNRDLCSAGLVLYVGDDYMELFRKGDQDNVPLALVIEGDHHWSYIGGVVVEA